ncbi:hypothetical protein [Brevibacillus parabrevis]|jgi:hypothetical protein|uniref:hypothetical protein n=1 Tax=Brevibacillus parabrevis TaxID=54914 RepID=UPI0024928C31|nr:hypothetical protein [Brevibacillus parabrevis]
MYYTNDWYDYLPSEICAMLTLKACPRSMFPRLQFDDQFRNVVAKSLNEVGYELVDDPISGYFDARLSPDVVITQAFREGDFPSGEGLSIPAKAMLVILWCNLVLPKYDPGLKRGLLHELHVTEDQLFENFKKQLGSRQNLRKALTTLKQFGFIQTIRGTSQIIAGPRLSTAIDSAKLYDYVRKHVIHLLVEEIDEQEKEAARILNDVDTQLKGGDQLAENHG